MKIRVKRIENRGRHGEYPALQNVVTGKVYVDTTLGMPRFLAADERGENIHGEFVGYNIPGAWHSFCGEPECPLRRDLVFELEKTAVGAYAGTPHKTIEELVDLARQRARAGQPAAEIVQDLVDGYSLGWQSANHRLIEQATQPAEVAA